MKSKTLALLFVTFAIRATAQGTGVWPTPAIIVTGRADLSLPADEVTVTLAVVTHAASAAAAGAANAERMQPLIAALRRRVPADSLIRMSGYNVDEDYQDSSPGAPRARRYTARNAVRVLLGRITDLGGIVDTALASGATEVSDVTFASTQARAARLHAIAIATQNAHAEAEAAARAVGSQLGGVVEVEIDPTASGFGRRVMQLEEVAVSRKDRTTLPPDIQVFVEVRIRYAIARSDGRASPSP